MLASRNLRWTGTGTSHGRPKLLRGPASFRQFSLNATTKINRPSLPLKSLGRHQTRSLSLFGWGGSSKNLSEHGQPASTTSPEVEIGNSSLTEVRSFKASHATSDAADPTLAHHHVSNIEPDIVEKANETLSFPSGTERISQIADGEIDITAVAERIGYLKEVCGLDYGIGTTALVQWCLEHIHITGGLSWAASIIAIAAITRAIMIKPTINAQKESAKLKDLNPIIAPMREKANQYLKEGNRQKQLEVSAQMRAIYKEYDVKFSRVFLPMIIQLPLQFSAFRLLSAAGRLPVPAFINESWLWNTDLGFADPYYLTPALSSFFMWLQIRQQAKLQTSGGPMSPALMKLFGNVLPALSLVFMSFQPGSVQLYFVTTSLFALINGEALRQDSIRKFLNLPSLHIASGLNSSTTAHASPGASSTSSATTNISQAAASANGLRLRPATVVVDKPDPSTSNRSGIDKFVDGIKEKGLGKNLKEVTQKWQTSKEDLQKEQNQKYEHERSQQLEIDREMRNQAARERMGRKQ